MFVNISTLSFLQQLLSTFPSAEAKESNSIENNKKIGWKNVFFWFRVYACQPANLWTEQ